MTPTPEKWTLEKLQAACRDGAAIRRTARLQPAGGPGDKVYPPTYEGAKYAKDDRIIDGAKVACVLLDSVQSQANRMELALLAAHRAQRINVPVISVDFSKDITDVGVITSLEAPHRLADAILRDSLLDGKRFRDSIVGKVLDTASVANAGGLFEYCPTALVFGLWDSSGPLGGLGTKFARVLVSEIVAVDVQEGVRPTSRIDPLNIQKDAGILYETNIRAEWTMDKSKAQLDKGQKPIKVGKDGKPSEVLHGNIAPSLGKKNEPNHGGVTFDHARQTAVVSLPALRRLRFPNAGGVPSPARDESAAARDEAAQTVLAALALSAITLSVAQGLDLRSRCLLVPEEGSVSTFELIGVDGVVERFSLTAAEACDLLKASVALATKQQLAWCAAGITLTPKPEFVALVKKSRERELSSKAESATATATADAEA